MTAATGSAALAPLRKSLAAKSKPRVVTAVGPETWLREEVLRTVAEAVLGSAASPDLVTLHGDQPSAHADGPLADFFDEARTSSLFGGAKVVALREAEAAVKADHKSFVAWLRKPSAGVTVVLLADDLPNDVLAAASDAGTVVRCGGRGAATEDPARFAMRRAAAREKRLGADEAEDLVRLVGDDLGALENAIEVLCLHAGDDTVIAPAAIRALFPGAREGDAQEFADQLLGGELAGALAAAGRCFDEGVPEAWGSSRLARDERSVAFVLVRELTKGLQRVLDARRQLDQGVPRRDVDLGRLPMRMRDAAVRAAASRRPESLQTMTLIVEETDRGMKSGGATGRVAIVRLATAFGRLR